MKPQKMTYEEFRDGIRGILRGKPDGLTWTQVKEELHLLQKVPNNAWVRRMEKDIGLKREERRGKIIWRVE